MSFRQHLASRASEVGLALEDSVAERMDIYYSLLSRWNKKINLTSIDLDSLSDAGMDRLFVEPLLAAPYVPHDSLDWIDLGSGGGSPAIPLKLVKGAARLTMIESRSRKAAFLREAARQLGLTDVVVMAERFESSLEQPQRAASADLLTVRAVRVDDQLRKVTKHLLRDGGRLLVFASNEPGGIENMGGLRRAQTVQLPGSGASTLSIFVRDDSVRPRPS